jgi:tetratricopeptide (TPR) repeat protein
MDIVSRSEENPCEDEEMEERLNADRESILSGRYFTILVFLHITIITITALLIYSNTFSAPFHFDDEPNIIENNKIKDLSNFWPPSGTRYIGFLSFALNHHLGGLEVFGYHLVNIAVHITNGFFLWWLVLLTFKTPVMERAVGRTQPKYFIALTAALIFISHPVQTQVVTYITQRFTSLATLFYLLSLVLFVKWRLSRGTLKPGPQAVIYVSSLVSAIVSMKTKEISFTLPFIIVLYEFSFFNDKTLKKRLSYLTPFLLTLAIIPLTLFMQKLGLNDGTPGVAETLRVKQIEDLVTLSPHSYLVTQFRVIVTYIRLLLLPVHQNLDYDYPLSHSLFEPGVFFSFIFLLSVFSLAIYIFTRSRKSGNVYALLTAFGFFWFFITLSVESSIIPIGDVINEHRIYLPSIGGVIAFGAGVFYVLDNVKIKISPLHATAILLLFTALPLSIATYKRNFIWSDEVKLWEDVVRKSPDKVRGHLNLGVAYGGKDQYDLAMREYVSVLKLQHDNSDAHFNIGTIYEKKGRIDEAIEEYKVALMLDPGYVDAHYNLGLVYDKQDRLNEAIEEYISALIVKPDFSDAHYNLGNAYYKKGLMDEAIEEYKLSLSLEPNLAMAHNNLGNAYYKKGLMDEAIEEYKLSLSLKANLAMAHNNLGNVYALQGRIEEAIDEYSKALELDPNYVDARQNLGLVYKQRGLKNEAVKELVNLSEVVSIIEEMLERGDIKSSRMANDLISKLTYARANLENTQASAKNMLEAAINLLEEQAGKMVSTEAAEELISYLNNIIAGL